MADEMKTNGAEIQQAVNAALNEQKAKKKKKKLIIIGVIIAIIVVIGLASGGSKGGTTTNGTVAASEAQKVDGQIGNYVCTIKGAEVCKNWEGKDAVKITYVFTNNASDAQSFDLALNDDLYQDGIGLESSFISVDDDWGIDVKIQPGATKEVSKVYLLRDKTTPIDVEIAELFSLNDEKVTYKVNL